MKKQWVFFLFFIVLSIAVYVGCTQKKKSGAGSGDIKTGPPFVSTYLGGNGDEFCESIALDRKGNVYVAGYTTSADFPTTAGSYQPTPKGKGDVFVMKFDKDLKTVLASTLAGGSENECAYSILFGKDDSVYIAGYTDSEDFPATKSAYAAKYSGGGGDAFILKMDGELKTVRASTFLGGSGIEDDHRSPELVQDKDGNIYIAGITNSEDFPTTTGAYKKKYGGGSRDVFVSKFDPDLKRLLASTFIGGKGDDRMGRSLCIDSRNNEICVAGYTMFSDDFPVTENAYCKRLRGGLDGFILKLDMGLSKITAATILDGWIYCMMIHENGDIYVGGHGGNKLPTPGAFWTLDREPDMGFISRLSNDLSQLKSATLLPGTIQAKYGGSIVCLDLEQTGNGDIVSAGWTKSIDFPSTAGSYDETLNGESDTYVLKMDKELSKIRASTFIGGSKAERWNRLATDKDGNFYIASYTLSPDFPATGGSAFENFNGGKNDGFIFRLNRNLSADVYETFHDAAKKNHLKKVRQLLSKKKELLEKVDKYGKTALHSAARYGGVSVSEYLIKKGANASARDEKGNTPLHLACIYRQDEVAELLIGSDVEINGINNNGDSPLALAAIFGTAKTIGLLLSNRADGSIRDKEGNTLLHIAASKGQIKKVQEILKYGPDIDSINKAGNTPLHLAVRNHHTEPPLIGYLLDQGASLSVTDGTGKNALHIATNPSIIEFLLKKGANANWQDRDGNTPLHAILMTVLKFKSYSDMMKDKVNILVAGGADPDIKNKKGISPMKLAIESGKKELIDLLRARK